jgi:hypothetical protein
MRGEFFCWLSHDDVYHPEKIARQVAQFQALGESNVILFSNFDIIDETSRRIGTGGIEEFARESSILAVVGTYVNGCSLLIPRAAFGTAGLFNESLRNSQDNELWLRMAVAGYRFRYMPDMLVRSRQHAEQGSTTDRVTHRREARAFHYWAVVFIGKQHRVDNAVGLFRILLARRLPGVAARLFRLLRQDRSLRFALSSMIVGAVATGRPAVMRRFARVPGIRRVMAFVRRRRFQSSSHYWEQRYRLGDTSGVGSYGPYAEYKAEVLNRFIAAHGVRKVADFGCGDGNQLKLLQCPHYLGLDVSSSAVERCRAMYRQDLTKSFLVNNGPEAIARVKSFGPELTMSLDVIYHLVEEETFERYLNDLFEVSSRYVVIYSTNFNRRYDSPHQVDRKFTDYIAERMPGWKPLQVVTNPYKGPDTQSDFYIYEKTGEGAAG